MMIHKTYKFRIYPHQTQATLIHKTICCFRFLFNHFPASRGLGIQRDRERFYIGYLLCQTSENIAFIENTIKSSKLGFVRFAKSHKVKVAGIYGKFQLK
ncbi:hypothetical protein BHL54_07320 [Bacillus cereus]|nr:hypothetical protein BHL54_07320 [Bacillus cereus]